MVQFSTLEKKFYCTCCKGFPVIDIPKNMGLVLHIDNEFVENVKCTICKNIGYVRQTA